MCAHKALSLRRCVFNVGHVRSYPGWLNGAAGAVAQFATSVEVGEVCLLQYIKSCTGICRQVNVEGFEVFGAGRDDGGVGAVLVCGHVRSYPGSGPQRLRSPDYTDLAV